MLALAASVLATSMIGSPHCAAMCGGFVVFYAAEGRGRAWLAHAAYHGGRLISYTVLGLAAGALGAGIERAGALAGLGRAAAWLAGIAMVLWGGAALLRALGMAGPVRPGGRAHAWIAPVLRAVHARPAALRGLVMGLVSTLLPCGWLYAYVAIAAGTGAPLTGALVMAVFWAGTVPLLVGLGVLARPLLGRLQRRLPVVAAVVMIVLGMLTLGGRLQPHVHGVHTAGTGHVHAAPHNGTDAAPGHDARGSH